MPTFPPLSPSPSRRGAGAYTIVEALIALTILGVFAVSSTVTLNLFNDRAAKNRNLEAARILMENCVGLALATNDTITPTSGSSTVNGLAVDVCSAIGSNPISQPVPLIVSRNSAGSPVVTGNLYWRVKNVGTTYSLNSANDLVQIDFVLQYTYRSKVYYYNLTTLKANV